MDFGEWLTQKLNEYHWDQSDLARKSGLTGGQISRLISGTRRPGRNSCDAIARAFDISVITVYRHAGILPPGPDDDVRFDDWKSILKQLPEAKREQLWKIAEIYLEDERKEETAAKLKPEPTTK